MKLNRGWHLANPMPKNPTIEQRINWHIAHKKHCACRDIPGKLKEEINRRKMML